MSELLYGARAELYDRIYHFKDYASEATKVAVWLESLGVSDGARLLEGACGTGNHLVHLRERFVVDGFDRSPEMITIAQRKSAGSRLWVADLRDFGVEQSYDAFVCLFSSIGYLTDRAQLRACAEAVARAVRPGGALVVEPWLGVAAIDNGRPTLQTAESPDLKIARATVIDVQGEIAVMPMTYLVARRGQPVETFHEVHRLWCAPKDELISAFADAGFDVWFDEAGLTAHGTTRGILLGTRRGA